MIEEVWKDVVGYEGYYLVSNLGNVRSIASGANRKIRTDWKGYRIVLLYAHGKYKMLKIHRLIATAFLDNPENKSDVNHINGIKHDNRLENLEWVTRSENIIHALKTGLSNHSHCTGEKSVGSVLTEQDVILIRAMKVNGATYKGIAEKFKVATSTIQAVVIYRSWKHVHSTLTEALRNKLIYDLENGIVSLGEVNK